MSASVISDAPAHSGSANASRQPGRLRRSLGWLTKALPTAAVMAILAGVAVWGHFSEWTMPKFSALVGNGATASVDDWCPEHGVPESMCIACNPALALQDKDYGWCRVHGVSQCLLEDPDVADLKAIPEIDPADVQRATRALELRPRVENNSLCKSYQKVVQFASEAALAKAGVDIDVVARGPVEEAVVSNGEVVYDQNTVTHLSSRATGIVAHVEKQVGDRVEANEVLALVDSTEVGQAKAELLQAITQTRLADTVVERLRPLAKDGTVPGRQFREAEANLQNAGARLLGTQQALGNLGFAVNLKDYDELTTEQIAQRIQFLGIPEELSDVMARHPTSNLFALRAAQPGVVVQRDIVVGEVVNSGTTLFTLADPTQMWLMLNVRQEDARYLRTGQTVRFRPSDAIAEEAITGRVSWISTAADEQTRTVEVRVVLGNSHGLLRANTFGIGRIVLREEPNAVVVPSQAIHWDGDCNVVFVRNKHWFQSETAKFFRVRTVRVGVQENGQTEIIAGLLPGEVIASKNSSVLSAQLLKSNLGAGCGCAH